MYVVFLCYYTSYLRSNWGKSWQDRKGSLLCSWVQQNCSTDMAMARLRVEDAGRGTDGCWMASCLVLLCFVVFLSDSCNFLGCEIMQTEIHPAIKFCCLGVWGFFPAILGTLNLVHIQTPVLNLSTSWSRQAAALTPRFSFQPLAEKHPCGAAVLPCKNTHAGPEEKHLNQCNGWELA